MKQSRKYIPDPRAVAEFRLMVLGEVLALSSNVGERCKKLRSLAARKWLHPDGTEGPIGFRTLQRWFAAVDRSRDRIAALMPAQRRDKGNVPSVREEQRTLLRKYWQERPESRWRNHYRNLLAESKEVHPSFSSVKRFLRIENMYPITDEKSKEKREKLSFEAAFVNEIWHLDCHHGSCRVVDDVGIWQVAKLIVYLDDKSRFVCHAQWYLHECCREICSAFEQSVLKCSLPHSVYTDNGSGMRGTEFREGLRRLGVILKYTGVESPYQNGKLERFWGTLEGQLLQMVPKDKPMTLAELNRYTQAWILKDYHLERHSELRATPLDIFINHNKVPLHRPVLSELRSAFRRSIPRKTRTQDGTVQINGVRFQLPATHRHIQNVIVRYAEWNLSVAELVDPRTKNVITEIFPVDKQGNSHSKRARLVTSEPISTKIIIPGISPHLRKLCKELDEETGIINFNPTIPIEQERR